MRIYSDSVTKSNYSLSNLCLSICLLVVCLSAPALAQQSNQTTAQPAMEINLFQMETKRIVRSPVLLSPNGSLTTFTEVIYLPHARQTVSKLYVTDRQSFRQKTAPAPPNTLLSVKKYKNHWWQFWRSKQPIQTTQTPQFSDTTLLSRINKPIYKVGLDEQKRFKFETLTAVDWSATGNKLLFKRKNGTLYVGLRTSDILVYDLNAGTISIYPELKRIIAYQWENKREYLPSAKQMEWDFEPLGWAPGSDTEVVVKAYGFEKDRKIFMGTFKYDITKAENAVVSLKDQPVAYSVNGVVAAPETMPATPEFQPVDPLFPELLQ